jgi:hypothetical protein
MKIASAAEFVICNYAIIVTLCGADSWRGLLMRPRRIVRGDFPLEPQEVTMNHIIERDTTNQSKMGRLQNGERFGVTVWITSRDN